MFNGFFIRTLRDPLISGSNGWGGISFAFAVVALLGLVGCETSSVPAVVETATPESTEADVSMADVSKAAIPNADAPKKVDKEDDNRVQVAVVHDPKKLVDKSFDDITFDIEPDAPFERSMLTPEIEALDGRRIRIRGYILPTAQKRGIKQFVLVRDNMECCFGPGAALYDCILISMVPGSTAEFSIRPVAVEGTFQIKEFKGFDGKHLAVFHLEGEKVK